MMTLRYTSSEIKSHFPQCLTVADLFRAVEKNAEHQGKVVCQFRINGVNFTEADEEKVAPAAVEEIQVVEILVDTPENLLNSVVENWVQELPRMVLQADDIATRLRDDGFQSPYTPLVRLVDSCQFLNDSVVSLRTFPAIHAVITLEVWDAAIQNMNKAVSETLTAFEKKDANWVADVIEYDLASSLQEWLEILGTLHGKLSHDGQDPASRPPLLPEGA